MVKVYVDRHKETHLHRINNIKNVQFVKSKCHWMNFVIVQQPRSGSSCKAYVIGLPRYYLKN